MQEKIITYHGNGRVTQKPVQVEQPTEDIDLSTMSEEDEREDPVFAAIVKHVTRQVQKSQEG